MHTISTITPCLWFDDQAEAAAAFYVAIFPDSRMVCRTTANPGMKCTAKPQER